MRGSPSLAAENRDQFFLEGLDEALLVMLLPATFHLNSVSGGVAIPNKPTTG